MNKTKFALATIVFALLFGALLLANHQRKQSAIYLLRDYPCSERLDAVIASHAQPGDGQDDVHPIKTFLSTSGFNDRAAHSSTSCQATQNGAGLSSVCGVTTGIHQKYGLRTWLGKAQIAALEQVLPTLPPNAATPPLERLLVVSFYRENTWTSATKEIALTH